jgi:hypothetical protein
MRSAKLAFALFMVFFILLSTVSAEDQYIRYGFWGSIDAGAGTVKQSFDRREDDDTFFFLGFKAGYTINQHSLIGIELSGWLIEASDLWDPNEGKGINQVFLITQLYPSKKSCFFAKLGGGYVSNWSNRPNEPSRKSGWGLTAGGGYDYLLDKSTALTPFVTYSYGKTGDWDYKAITFGLSLMFH